MGPERSLRKVLQDDRCVTKWSRLSWWSRKHSWVERTLAYGDYLDAELRRKNEKARLEMADRHAKMAVLGQGIVVEAFRRIKPEDLTPSQAVQWFDTLVKIERLSRGEPTDIQKAEHSGPGGGPMEFANMTDVERRAEMIRCLKEMGRTDEQASAISGQLMGDESGK
jgi:hypothetical protein